MDLVFRDAQRLQRLYPQLVRLGMTSFSSLTFAVGVTFPAVGRRIRNAVNAGAREKARVKTLPVV